MHTLGCGESSSFSSSFGITRSEDLILTPEAEWEALEFMMNNVYVQLYRLGVVIISSAGNNGWKVSPLLKWPKWLADKDIVLKGEHGLGEMRDQGALRNLAKSMILVGAVRHGGIFWPASQLAPQYRVMAPGVGWGISSPYAAKNRGQL